MREITSTVLLGKGELLYLIQGQPARGRYTELLTERFRISEPDAGEALKSLIRKNILYFAGGRLVTVRLYDFLIRHICGADKCVITETIEGDRLVLIAAYRDADGVAEAVKGAWDACPSLKLTIYPGEDVKECSLPGFLGALGAAGGETAN